MRHDNKDPSISLESVVQQFKQWRATREKRGKIPDALWALVIPLMGQYSRSKISTALRVSHDQLKQHTLSLLPTQQQKQSATFVEYPLLMPAVAGNCVIEFVCENGLPIKISGLHPSQINPILSMLRGIG